MASVQIPAGFALVEVHCNSRGIHDCVSLYGISLSEEIDQGACDGMAGDLLAAYITQLSNSSSATFVKMTQNFGGVLSEFESTNGHGIGARAGDLCAPQVMVLIKKNTAGVGRKFHGRTFFPDPHEGDVFDDGSLSSGAQTAYQSMADDISAALSNSANGAADFRLLHSDATAPTMVTSFNVEPKVATLRRRFTR